jgi:hypothetical protein
LIPKLRPSRLDGTGPKVIIMSPDYIHSKITFLKGLLPH